MVNLDRSNTSCNILGDKSRRICVSNQKKDAKLSVFNIITRINESRTLIKHISCECKYKLEDRKCHSDQKLNRDKCWCECKYPKKQHVCKNKLYLQS